MFWKEKSQSIFPLIVPRDYFAQKEVWSIPGLALKHEKLALTWVDLTHDQSMAYLTGEKWRKRFSTIDKLHQTALQNLRSQTKKQLFTHGRQDANGQYEFASFIPDDGLGTSRLLLIEEIKAQFSRPCVFGIPDRSCGFVIATDIPKKTFTELKTMVSKCFKDATTPMLDGLFDPELFRVTSESL